LDVIKLVSEYYKNATGWGVVIMFIILIFYLGVNLLFFNPAPYSAPLPFWVFWGPTALISQSGLFIYLNLISRKELTDAEDKKKSHENYLVLISSFIGFFIWLIVLVILTLAHLNFNIYLSIFCGAAVIYIVLQIFRVIDAKRNENAITRSGMF